MFDFAQQSTLLGNVEQIKQFTTACNAGRLHHAWLLTGVKGVGKAKFAREAAKYLLSNRSDILESFEYDTKVSKLVESGAHPDLFILKPEDDEDQVIKIDEARKLQEFMRLTPALSERKVVIIDSVDKLNANASNALLKALEEPQPNTTFMLVCSGPIIATIKSRCVSLIFKPLSFEHFAEVIKQHDPKQVDLEWLYQMSHGSLHVALKLADSDGKQMLQAIDKILKIRPSAQELLQLRKQLNKDNFNLFVMMFDELALHKLKAMHNPLEKDAFFSWFDAAKKLLSDAEIFNLDQDNVALSIFSSSKL